MTNRLAGLVVGMVAIETGCGGTPSSSSAGTPTSKPTLPGVVEYKVVDTNDHSSGWQVVAGPSGNVWFTGDTLGTIGSVGPTGRVSQVTLP